MTSLPGSACLTLWFFSLVIFSLGPHGGNSVQATEQSDFPSTLDRPDGRGPIFLMGSFSVGGTKNYDDMAPGFGLTILFRPQAAANFLNFLYRWNSAMVLQADYRRVASDRRLLAADFIVRRYLADMKEDVLGTSYFVGFGLGGAEVTFPVGDSSSSEIWYSYLIEVGSEKSPSENVVFVLKAQWRQYDHQGRDYSGWSVHFGFGIPLPW